MFVFIDAQVHLWVLLYQVCVYCLCLLTILKLSISASLLPPAVNSGLLFAYSFLGRVFSNVVALRSSSLNNTNEQFSSPLNCAGYINNEYRPLYTCNLATEAAILACCSFLLAIVNIICIIIMALIILRIKEVVPLNQANKNISEFFHHDVKVARDYNKTVHTDDLNITSLTPSSLARNHVAQSIVNRWKTFKSQTSPEQQPVQSSSMNTDLESTNAKNKHLFPSDMESRRKLFRLITFSKEYDLDIFNKDDYGLTNRDCQEKVRLLVNDLIDTYQEIPSVFVDLYRLQPSGTHTTTDKEHIAFYQEIIEFLPPKWLQLFNYERQRRRLPSWPLTFDRSYSTNSYPLETYEKSKSKLNDDNLHQSLKKQNKKKRAFLRRQSSVPESSLHSKTINEETEVPIEGTRFRIAKPTTNEMLENESKLI
jgi:hypothetical protein